MICLDPGTTKEFSNTTQLIAESNKQAMNNVVSKPMPKQWSHPKRFEDESVEAKISMILKWIFGSDPHDGILSGVEKISNITTRLTKMKYNGYLRLCEVDTNMLMNSMTETSRILFNDFKTKHKDDEWKCPLCNFIFTHNQMEVKWKCERCIFFYHEKCAKKREIKGKVEYSLCDSCFFLL